MPDISPLMEKLFGLQPSVFGHVSGHKHDVSVLVVKMTTIKSYLLDKNIEWYITINDQGIILCMNGTQYTVLLLERHNQNEHVTKEKTVIIE